MTVTKRPEAVDYRELPAARTEVIEGSVTLPFTGRERRKVCRSCGRPHARLSYAQPEPVETVADAVKAFALLAFLALAAFGSAYFVGLYGWPF